MKNQALFSSFANKRRMNTAMSNQAFKWAKAQHIDDSTVKMLLLVLAEYANGQNQCWYKQADLARDISKSVRTVRRTLVTLRDLGLIHTEQLPSPTRGGKGQLLVTILTGATGHACPDDPHDTASNRTQVTAATGHACPQQPDTRDRGNRTLLATQKPLREPSIEPSREPSPFVPSGDGARSRAHVVVSKGMTFIGWADAFIAALQTAKTADDVEEFFRLNQHNVDRLKNCHRESADRVHKAASEVLADAPPLSRLVGPRPTANTHNA
ncbi:helix-turn-helix domain-containing protein [Bradyrhizobium septentrionale]|uniref:Helix-turn-helix domain-containing protein n=1 Tax=Bradyrhizobium septentrionale TaxID=1404411 RepID=A0ABZ2P980_9BRAD